MARDAHAARPTVALCACTCNDARLLHGLLASVAGWTLRPDALVVLDDGSSPPFVPQPLPPGAPPLTLLRHDRNLGAAAARNACADAAATDVIVSLDCDIRVPPDWLERFLPSVLDPAVGLVGCPCRSAGDTFTARYMRVMLAPSPRQERWFIPGGAWGMRRETWTRCGGMAGHAPPTGEDVLLSRRVRALGLGLAWRPDLPVRQVSALSRVALARRCVAWFSPCAGARSGRPGGRALPCAGCGRRMDRDARSMLLGVLRRGVLAAMHAEPLFIYQDLLYFALCLSDRMACAAAHDPDGDAQALAMSQAAFRTAFRKALAAFPRTLDLLRQDLAAAGTPQPAPSNPPVPHDARAWNDLLALLSPLRGPLLTRLESRGVDDLLAEDAWTETDCSFYAAP